MSRKVSAVTLRKTCYVSSWARIHFLWITFHPLLEPRLPFIMINQDYHLLYYNQLLAHALRIWSLSWCAIFCIGMVSAIRTPAPSSCGGWLLNIRIETPSVAERSERLKMKRRALWQCSAADVMPSVSTSPLLSRYRFRFSSPLQTGWISRESSDPRWLQGMKNFSRRHIVPFPRRTPPEEQMWNIFRISHRGLFICLP